MSQNVSIATNIVTPLRNRMHAGAEPDVVEIKVRDLPEASAFYASIFGDCKTICTEASLQFRLDSLLINLIREANVSARGRVSTRYQLVNSGYVPVPHPITVTLGEWRVISKRLVRSKFKHELYIASNGDELNSQSSRIAIDDPSGNVLEIRFGGPDLRIAQARRRKKWLARSAVVFALAAFFVFVLWPYEDPPKIQNSISMSF